MRRAAASAAVLLAVRLASAGTLDDMELRDNVETAIRGNAATAGLHLKIDVEDGTATAVGRVRDLAQADDVVALASKVRGIRAVDRSGLRLEHDSVPDDEIARGALRAIAQMPKLGSSAIDVDVAGGVVTLTGTIKSAAFRGDVRRVVGSIDGVVDLVDRLDSPEAPDEAIQKVLDRLFSPRTLPAFPGAVRARVDHGAVALEGRVPRLFDRLAAERAAWEINGVRSVDVLLELSGSSAVKVVRP